MHNVGRRCARRRCRAWRIPKRRHASTSHIFRRTYYTIALFLFLSPLAALGTAYFARAQSSLVFFIEWFAVWVFAAYWVIKSAEIKITSAERRALYGALKNVEGVGVVPEQPSGEQLRRMSGPGSGSGSR